MAQFTLEAVTLCAVGGVIGVLIGSAIGFGLHWVLPSVVSVCWVALAFCCACAIGLVFGIYRKRLKFPSGVPFLMARLYWDGRVECYVEAGSGSSFGCGEAAHCRTDA
jgi:hypothetical protein